MRRWSMVFAAWSHKDSTQGEGDPGELSDPLSNIYYEQPDL